MLLLMRLSKLSSSNILIPSASTVLSKACTSKKASATHIPHAPVQASMAQRILAKETTTAADDGAMDDVQQVLEESPARLC